MLPLPHKTHPTVFCLMAWKPRAEAAWSFHLPSFLTCLFREDDLPYFRAQWPQRMCASPQPCLPSPKSHLCIMLKPHVSPEPAARGERWSGRGIQETAQTEMKDALKKAGRPCAGSTARGAFSSEGCSKTTTANKRPGEGGWGPTQRNGDHTSNAGPNMHPCIQSCCLFSLAGKLVYLGKTNPQH